MVVGIFCNCGGIHKTVEEWKECPMSEKPRSLYPHERYSVQQCEPPRSRAFHVTDIILNVLMACFIFPLMYLLIGMAKIADYISRRRLPKPTSDGIQEPATRRPRRAF